MKQTTVENINDFKEFDYNYVIQSNFVKDKEYRIDNGIIEGINTEKYLHYAVYTGEELLNAICDYGKQLYEILKENLVINTKEYLQEFIEKNKDIEIIGMPFGIREDRFYIFYYDEIQNQKALDIIKNWCEEYGFPIKPKDVDVEKVIIKDGKKQTVNAYADILPKKQSTTGNMQLDNGTLDEVIIKFLIIYIVNDLWTSLVEINSGINNLRKCNQKLKKQSEVSTSELYNYKYRLNESIDKLNENILINNKLSKVKSVDLKQQTKEIIEIEQQLIEIRNDFSLQLSEYCYKFGDNLMKQIIYNKKKQKFFSIMVSDNVLDLAWDLLISKNCAPISNFRPKICKDCGKEFTPTGHNQIRCHTCLEKLEDTKTTDYDILRKTYKSQALEIIKNNPNIPEKIERALREELIDKQYRYISVKQPDSIEKYNQYINKELHSL